LLIIIVIFLYQLKGWGSGTNWEIRFPGAEKDKYRAINGGGGPCLEAEHGPPGPEESNSGLFWFVNNLF